MPAIAVVQSKNYRLTRRYRGQARSYRKSIPIMRVLRFDEPSMYTTGRPSTAGVSFALFDVSGFIFRNFLRFISEFAECFLVGCAPVRFW